MEELESAPISPVPNAVLLSWGTFCDLLDDRLWDETAPSLSDPASSWSQDTFRLREHLSQPGQLFLPAHSTRHPLEVFWLKLCLFESLCRQVLLFHRHAQRPLLRLDSDHVHVAIQLNDNGYLPIRWSGSVTLPSTTQHSSSDAGDMPAEMKNVLTHVPRDTDSGYLSPLIRNWPAGREVRGTALIESIDAIPGDEGDCVQGLVRIHFIADEIAAEDFSSRDVFGLAIPFTSGTVRVWTRKVDTPERGIVLCGVTNMLSGQAWQALQREIHQVVSRSVANIYLSYSPAADVYSLGMLLFRALLGSNPPRWNRIVSLLPSVVTSLPPAVQGIEYSDSYSAHTRVRDVLQELGDIFVCHDIPDDLWWDGILIGLRAVSRIPGFSYGCKAPDEMTTRIDTAVELLLLEAAQLARRANIELFEPEERDAAIAAACDAALHHFGMA